MKTLARERDKAEILIRLKNVQLDSVPVWGRMSAHQMICHLSDAFRMVTGQKTVSSASGPLQRTVVKWIALYLPVHWPVGILTRPEIDQAAGGTCPTDFAADVAELESLVAVLTDRRKGFDPPAHPIFGPLSQRAWLRWAYLHMDHHLRQFGT